MPTTITAPAMSLDNEYNAQPTWRETGRKFWPDTREEAGARQALKLGWFSYNATLLLQLVFGWKLTGDTVGWLADMAFVAAISFAVYKGSRVAAVIGLLYTITASAMTLWYAPTGCVFLMVTLLVLNGAVNGVRGTFALRRILRSAVTESPLG